MKSIRQSITRSVIAGVAGVLILCAVAVFLTVRFKLIHRFDETLLAKAEGIISATEYEDGEIEMELDVESFAGFGVRSARDYFEFVHDDLRREVHSPGLADLRLATGPLPVRDGPTFRSVRLPGGEPGRMVMTWFAPIDDNSGRPTRPVCLVVASHSRELERTIAMLGGVLALSTSIALVLAIPLMRIGLDRGLAPLSRLAEEAGALNAEALDHRFAVDGMPGELAPVAERLNDLLERLDRSFERERRFSGDAAHELRAPLAELRAVAELALAWPDQATPEQFADVLAVSVEMQSLVEHLIALARAEDGTSPVERTRFDFAARIREVVDRLADLAEARRIRITSSLRPGSWTSDPVIWSMIIRNLVGNAVRYSPEGSEIEIGAAPGSLIVRNPAPDLEPGDLEHFGERFWRKDGARSGYGHSGLGLALVKAHAALLGGSFSARLDPASGLLEVSVAEPNAPRAALHSGEAPAPIAAPASRR